MLWEELFANHGRAGNEKQKEKNPTIKMMGFLILSIKKWFGWTIFKNPLEIRVLIGKHSLLCKEKNTVLLCGDKYSANSFKPNVPRIWF